MIQYIDAACLVYGFVILFDMLVYMCHKAPAEMMFQYWGYWIIAFICNSYIVGKYVIPLMIHRLNSITISGYGVC